MEEVYFDAIAKKDAPKRVKFINNDGSNQEVDLVKGRFKPWTERMASAKTPSEKKKQQKLHEKALVNRERNKFGFSPAQSNWERVKMAERAELKKLVKSKKLFAGQKDFIRDRAKGAAKGEEIHAIDPYWEQRKKLKKSVDSLLDNIQKAGVVGYSRKTGRPADEWSPSHLHMAKKPYKDTETGEDIKPGDKYYRFDWRAKPTGERDIKRFKVERKMESPESFESRQKAIKSIQKAMGDVEEFAKAEKCKMIKEVPVSTSAPIAKSEVDILKEENDALKKQIDELKKSSPAPKEIIKAVAEPAISEATKAPEGVSGFGGQSDVNNPSITHTADLAKNSKTTQTG